MIKEAYNQAIEVLKKCSTPHGFFAAYPGYDAVWARDSMIISLGASLNGFQKTFAHSLITLGNNQSELGQIPNAVDKFSKREKKVDYASIDSSLWFIIGHHIYKGRYHDSSLFNHYQKNIEKALIWLRYQDFGERGLLIQPPTTDWQDCFPHRYGFTINTQALYYRALKLSNDNKRAAILKNIINHKDFGLWKEDYFLSWRWKNHRTYYEQGEWFDTLGNLLAVIFDLADHNQAVKIMDYIEQKKIAKPFPIKSMYPALTPKSRHWQDYFNDCAARTPYHYLNGGIWTYIGGFYVLALIKMNKFQEAEKQLQKLAEANMQKPYFNEWLNGITGKPGGSQSGENGSQGWNAGMYLLAYHSVERRKRLV